MNLVNPYLFAAEAAPYTMVAYSYKRYDNPPYTINTPTGSATGDIWLFLNREFYANNINSFQSWSALASPQGTYVEDWYQILATTPASTIPLPGYGQGMVYCVRKASGSISVVGSNFTYSTSATTLTCSAISGSGTLILRVAYQSATDQSLSVPSGWTLMSAVTPQTMAGGLYERGGIYWRTNNNASVTATISNASSMQMSVTLLNG